MKYLNAKDIRESGLLHELNRMVLHPLGIAAEVDLPSGKISLQDHREDPEGIIFQKDTLDPVLTAAFQTMWKKRKPAREAALGYMVQPHVEKKL